jgi:hypothetical protein
MPGNEPGIFASGQFSEAMSDHGPIMGQDDPRKVSPSSQSGSILD